MEYIFSRFSIKNYDIICAKIAFCCRNVHELINLCKQIQQSTTPLFFLKALKFPNIVFFHFDEKIGKLQL